VNATIVHVCSKLKRLCGGGEPSLRPFDLVPQFRVTVASKHVQRCSLMIRTVYVDNWKQE
jgi:hypothetical protein